jgi:hypothetical protein
MDDLGLKMFNGGDGFGTAPAINFKGHILAVPAVIEILSI